VFPPFLFYLKGEDMLGIKFWWAELGWFSQAPRQQSQDEDK